jgi:glycosyltransferase involved in cell wall biosynthesis
MNTLHINTERTWRGGEQQTLYLAAGLMARGHGALVLCRPGFPLAERARAAGVPTHELDVSGEVHPGAIVEIARLVSARGVDIVHMHTSHAHTLGALAGILAPRTKLVVSRRVDFSIRKHATSILKYRIPIDRIIAISHAVRRVLIDDGIPPDLVSVVHSGIDLSRFDHVEVPDYRAEFGLAEDAVVVGNVAALADHKGHRFLLDAVPQVLQRHPEARTIICGDGELWDELHAQRARLGIEKQVIFAGFRTDVPALLGFFDLFVMSSHLEGLNTSILDALAMRRPVVATDAGGIPEIIRDGETGLLVPAKDPPALADAVCRLVEDRGLAHRLAEGGRRWVEKEFTTDAMVEGTLAIYRELLSSP